MRTSHSFKNNKKTNHARNVKLLAYTDKEKIKKRVRQMTGCTESLTGNKMRKISAHAWQYPSMHGTCRSYLSCEKETKSGRLNHRSSKICFFPRLIWTKTRRPWLHEWTAKFSAGFWAFLNTVKYTLKFIILCVSGFLTVKKMLLHVKHCLVFFTVYMNLARNFCLITIVAARTNVARRSIGK